MSLQNLLLYQKIKMIESQNAIMKMISTRKGFNAFYDSSMWQFKTPVACFNYCNSCFFDLFGSLKYESFEAFLQDNKKPVVSYATPSDTKERDYLLAWFKYKGFDTWTSFKALILHYYPDINERDLLNFYKGIAIDSNTLKGVGYTKQIIGE